MVLDSVKMVAMTRKLKPGKLAPCGDRDLLGHPQDLVYQAWEIPNLNRPIALTTKALASSLYCADVYMLLAETATNGALAWLIERVKNQKPVILHCATNEVNDEGNQ
jgi:hypothetical protein